jgi:hypothetical protein
MTRHAECWGLAACGAVVGGAAVWGLAAAARVGWLRALLDIYPKSSWDRITWVLIPVLLMLPLIAQGTAVALASSSRPAPAGRGIAGSATGSLAALVVGAILVVGARRFPAIAGGSVAGALPAMLILGYGVVLVAWWLTVVTRPVRHRWMGWAAVVSALAAAGAMWLLARGWVLSASYVFDRAEIIAYFIAVTAGGGLGAAWAVRPRDAAN